MKAWLTLFSALLVATIRAEEIKLADGQIVKGDISRVEPDGLVVMTDNGIEKISFFVLPEETQKKYGFDIKKMDEYRAQQRVVRQQILDAQVAAVRAQQQRLAEKQFDESKLTVDARVLQIMDKGVLARISEKVKVQGTETVTLPPATALERTPRTVLRPTTTEETRLVAERAMIFGLPKGLVDDEVWQGALWPAGTYSYPGFDGARKTVRAYATSKELAASKLAEPQ